MSGNNDIKDIVALPMRTEPALPHFCNGASVISFQDITNCFLKTESVLYHLCKGRKCLDSLENDSREGQKGR